MLDTCAQPNMGTQEPPIPQPLQVWSQLSTSVTNRFIHPRPIGNGSFGMVFLATDTKHNRPVAVKSIFYKADHNNMLYWKRELDLLRDIANFNITCLHTWLEEPTMLVLVLEYAAGGSLESRCRRVRRPLTQRSVRFFMYQTLFALDFLHSLRTKEYPTGIVHRDVKPDNILLATNDEFTLVKLCDFGYARPIDPSKQMTAVGTANYAAPETFHDLYDQKVDVWCTGMTMARLLTGEIPPYTKQARTEHDMSQFYCEPGTRRLKVAWEAASKARVFVERLLQVNPQCRLSVLEALQHEWFRDPILRQDLQYVEERLRLPGAFQLHVFQPLLFQY